MVSTKHFCFLLIVVLLLSLSTLTLTQVVGPIGFNQLVSLDASGNAVIRLTGFDTTGVPVCQLSSILISAVSSWSLSYVFFFYFLFLSLVASI